MRDPAHILIVDDTPSNLRALADLLAPNYEIRVATNGQDALDTVADEPPDLILLDILMPEMDGYAVCRELKRTDSSRDIPVIFITAKDEVEDETHGFEIGAVDYITKPFDGQIVMARVRNQISIKARIDELKSTRQDAKLTRNIFNWQEYSWRVRFRNGDVFLLPDAKGASYLAMLLMNPGRYFPVEELAFHVSQQDRSIFLTDARQMLDVKTVQHFAGRVDALLQRRKVALESGDLDTFKQTQAEMDWIIGELKRAGGMGKDKRYQSLDRERMRKSIGNAIRRCLTEIEQKDQNLAQHLQFPHLRMGYELIYEPGNGESWHLQ